MKKATLKLGVVGEKESGKTVLLSRMVGYAADELSRRGDLSLSPADDHQGPLLRQSYQLLMTRNEWPDRGTQLRDSTDFRLRMTLKGELNSQFATLCWSDYAGGIWDRDRPDPKEATKSGSHGALMLAQFRRLMASDVTLVLIDGGRLSQKGDAYLAPLFAGIEEGVRWAHRAAVSAGDPLPSSPPSWLVALTKADLMGADYTAQDLADDVTSCAGASLTKLGRTLKLKGNSMLGRRYLRLSAAELHQGEPNASKSIGLDVLLPLVFLTAMERISDVRSDLPFFRRPYGGKHLLRGGDDDGTRLKKPDRAVRRLGDVWALPHKSSGVLEDQRCKYLKQSKYLEAAVIRAAQLVDAGGSENYVFDVNLGRTGR